MRILVFSSICVLLMAPSCQDKTTTALRRSQIARSWLKEKPDSIKRWIRYSMYDPYQSGTYYMGDAGNPEFLELASQGEFHQYDTAQQSYGNWFINRSDSTLNLSYQVRNNLLITREAEPATARQQYKLIQMSEDSLILETQGRHGMLLITYLPAPKPTEEVSE